MLLPSIELGLSRLLCKDSSLQGARPTPAPGALGRLKFRALPALNRCNRCRAYLLGVELTYEKKQKTEERRGMQECGFYSNPFSEPPVSSSPAWSLPTKGPRAVPLSLLFQKASFPREHRSGAQEVTLPWSATFSMLTLRSLAMKPITEKMTKPAKMLVALLVQVTMRVSLRERRRECAISCAL